MKNILLIFTIISILSILDYQTVQGSVSCSALFSHPFESQINPLPSLKRAEMNDSIIQLIYNYERLVFVERNMKTPDYIISVEDKNRNFPVEIKKAYSDVMKELIQFFKHDSQLQGFKIEDYENAANRVLEWTIVNAYTESVNRRAAIEMERYRLYLIKKGIDPNATPQKWENVFNQFGFEYLIHAGGPDALMGILKSKKILTRKVLNSHEGLGGDGTMIYFGLPESSQRSQRPHYKFQGERGASWNHSLRNGGFIILLPSKALDTFRWSHMNSFWEFGKLDNSSFLPQNSTAGFLNFINTIDIQNSSVRFLPEIIFKDSIDLEKTDFKILLNADAKEDFLKAARENDIPEWILERIE